MQREWAIWATWLLIIFMVNFSLGMSLFYASNVDGICASFILSTFNNLLGVLSWYQRAKMKITNNWLKFIFEFSQNGALITGLQLFSLNFMVFRCCCFFFCIEWWKYKCCDTAYSTPHTAHILRQPNIFSEKMTFPLISSLFFSIFPFFGYEISYFISNAWIRMCKGKQSKIIIKPTNKLRFVHGLHILPQLGVMGNCCYIFHMISFYLPIFVHV